MENIDINAQNIIVSRELIALLDQLPQLVQDHILSTVPVCDALPSINEKDFDYCIGQVCDPRLILDRLEAVNYSDNAFVRLLAGALSRDNAMAAHALLDHRDDGSKVEVSAAQMRLLAQAFSDSPRPSVDVLKRIVLSDTDLGLPSNKNGRLDSAQYAVSLTASTCIKQDKAEVIEAMAQDTQLLPLLFPARWDYWSLVKRCVSDHAPKCIDALSRMQDEVFVRVQDRHMTPGQHNNQRNSIAASFHELVEKLAGEVRQDSDGALITLSRLLDMDFPISEQTLVPGCKANWHIIAALAPVQAKLGDQYINLAESLLRSGHAVADITMDALVFGTDEWWNRCLGWARKDPSSIQEQIEFGVIDFLEGELTSRIGNEDTAAASMTDFIDYLAKSDATSASELSARLIKRLPEFLHAIGSPEQTGQWTDDLSKWNVDQSSSGHNRALTSAMFESVIMNTNTPPALEVSRPSPRM